MYSAEPPPPCPEILHCDERTVTQDPAAHISAARNIVCISGIPASSAQPSLAMLAHQQSLPRLPVPRLEDTHARFLRSARPLLTDEEYARTERIAAEFFGPSGRAQHLQQRLTQRAEEKKDSSWLSEWWLNCAYLVPRCPVVVYVSYFYQFIDDPRPQFSTQTGRAASLITAALKFRDMVVRYVPECLRTQRGAARRGADAACRNELEPEFMGRGDKKEPLCMDMYQYMFNSCRIPALGKDSYECYDPQANTHIIVARKNRFYELPTVFGGRQLSTMELDMCVIVDRANACVHVCACACAHVPAGPRPQPAAAHRGGRGRGARPPSGDPHCRRPRPVGQGAPSGGGMPSAPSRALLTVRRRTGSCC